MPPTTLHQAVEIVVAAIAAVVATVVAAAADGVALVAKFDSVVAKFDSVIAAVGHGCPKQETNAPGKTLLSRRRRRMSK